MQPDAAVLRSVEESFIWSFGAPTRVRGFAEVSWTSETQSGGIEAAASPVQARDPHARVKPQTARASAGDDRREAAPAAGASPQSRLMGTMRDRMRRGEPYIADDPALAADYGRAQDLLDRYNATRHGEQVERDRLLRVLLGRVGDGVVVKPTFRCDYGTPITIGGGTFVNYDCVMLDVAPITIGASCQIASRVQLLTATHPIDPEPRRHGWEYAKPIRLGDNVWLGGGVIVCPGVSIGDDTVVGAGAVVTRDLPAGVVAFGAPARVIRKIGDQDRIDMPKS